MRHLPILRIQSWQERKKLPVDAQLKQDTRDPRRIRRERDVVRGMVWKWAQARWVWRQKKTSVGNSTTWKTWDKGVLGLTMAKAENYSSVYRLQKEEVRKKLVRNLEGSKQISMPVFCDASFEERQTRVQ